MLVTTITVTNADSIAGIKLQSPSLTMSTTMKIRIVPQGRSCVFKEFIVVVLLNNSKVIIKNQKQRIWDLMLAALPLIFLMCYCCKSLQFSVVWLNS